MNTFSTTDSSTNQHHSNWSRPHYALYNHLQTSSSSYILSDTFRVITGQCLFSVVTFGSSSLAQTHLTSAHPGHATPHLTPACFGPALPQFTACFWPSLSCLTVAQLTSIQLHNGFLDCHEGYSTRYRHSLLVWRLFYLAAWLPGLSSSSHSALPSHTSTTAPRWIPIHTTMHSSSLPAHHISPSFALLIVVESSLGLCVLYLPLCV